MAKHKNKNSGNEYTGIITVSTKPIKKALLITPSCYLKLTLTGSCKPKNTTFYVSPMSALVQ